MPKIVGWSTAYHLHTELLLDALEAPIGSDIQDTTGGSLKLEYVDHGSTGEPAAQAVVAEGIMLHGVKLGEAKSKFVLLPRRWGVERSFARAPSCPRLVKDYERCSITLPGFPVVAFVGY